MRSNQDTDYDHTYRDRLTIKCESRPLVPFEYVASKWPPSVGNNGSVDLKKRSCLEEHLDALSTMSSTFLAGS